VDEDDSAIGNYSFGTGLTFPNGPAAWLDDHLTNAEMAPFIPNAGAGAKITAKFKGRVISVPIFSPTQELIEPLVCP
jgi:hypothetical protein